MLAFLAARHRHKHGTVAVASTIGRQGANWFVGFGRDAIRAQRTSASVDMLISVPCVIEYSSLKYLIEEHPDGVREDWDDPS